MLGCDVAAMTGKHEVWEQREAALGPAHLVTILAASSYVESWSKLGRDEEARPIEHDVWEQSVAVLSPAHLVPILAAGS